MLVARITSYNVCYTKLLRLLFLLQESPQLHRIENLVIGAADRSGQVKVNFKYLTLVISPAPVETSDRPGNRPAKPRRAGETRPPFV